MSADDATPPPPVADEAPVLTLAEKLAAIAGSLKRFEKDDRVTGTAGYAFASVDSMSDVIRPAMAAHGVVMYPRAVEVIECQQYVRDRVSNSGETYQTIQWRTVVKVTWHVADNREVMTLESVGEALDTSDKSANKAQTSARKYAMIQLFNISTGDERDPDNERVGDDGEQRTRARGSGRQSTPTGPRKPNSSEQKLTRDALRELLALGNDDTPDVIALWLSERYPAMKREDWLGWIKLAREEGDVSWPDPLDVEHTKGLTQVFKDRAKRLKPAATS